MLVLSWYSRDQIKQWDKDFWENLGTPWLMTHKLPLQFWLNNVKLCIRKINVWSFLLFTILLSSWIIQMLVTVDHRILIQFFAALFWIFTSTLCRIALNFSIKIWEALVLFCIALVRTHTLSSNWCYSMSKFNQNNWTFLPFRVERERKEQSRTPVSEKSETENLMSETREDLLQG